MSKLTFKNYGGSYQLRIQDAGDLERVQTLADTHWAATSIPIDSLNCDHTFVSFIDIDKNGRIRTDEFRKALAWLFRFLANHSHLSEGTDILQLSDIDTSHSEGQKLKASAELILTNLNSQDTEKISLSQVRDVQSIMANTTNNGDGIIPPDAVSNPDLAQFITSVIKTVGSAMDACGKQGISQEQLALFFQETQNYLAWQANGAIPKDAKATEIMFWGTETPQAYEVIISLEKKIDQYFAQCAMAGFDERAIAKMRLSPKELEEIDFKNKTVMESHLLRAPLANPGSEAILDLKAILNPLYVERLSEFKEKILKRIFKKPIEQLSKKQWSKVKAIFAPYKRWIESKTGTQVEKLGQDKLNTYLNGAYRQQINDFIAKDLAAADDLNQLHNLEKLILYQKWLMELANNFVSFANLYSPQRRSLLEIGTLIIDGREMTFTMKIRDRQAHKKIAEASFIYLMYLEITGRQDKDIKFEIAAAVTSGNSGRLRIGKRGVFFTIDGIEWDAKVIDIVENPISLWESIKAPFTQFISLIKKQTDKFTKSSQDKAGATLSASTGTGARDLLLGGSVAIAALGTAFAYITKALSQVKPIHILGMLTGLMIFILLPGIFIGLVKMRKRNMSVLLEASDWAVNAHMGLTTILGHLFTHTPRLPKGACREQRDTVTQFVKKFGHTSFCPQKLIKLFLIALFISLCLILVLTIQTRWFSIGI